MMGAWDIDYTSHAKRQVRKLDAHARKVLDCWIKANIIGCDNPRRLGGIMNGDYAGMWRYRVGDYRILCELHDATCTVLAVSIGHRRQVYDHSYTLNSRRR